MTVINNLLSTGSRKKYPLLLLTVFALTGCYQDKSESQIQSAGIPMPIGVQSLPVNGVLSAKVLMDAQATPLYNDNYVDISVPSVSLEFVAPEGEHTFTVIFEYFDQEFVRADAKPWELARWTSDLEVVAAGESLSLNVSSYFYEDSDADGISNAEELSARTDPGDVNDPGEPPVDPPPPVEPPVDPPPPVEPPVDPVIPDGIWHGDTQDQAITNIIAILQFNRIMMIEGDLIYDGTYTADDQGAFTGSVDVYTTTDGKKLTTSAQVAITGNRPNETALTLNLNDGIQLQTINFTFDAIYERDSALSLISRMWGITTDHPRYTLTFPIDSNGTLTGASDTEGCLFAGNLDIVDAQYNVYSVTLSLENQKKHACDPYTGTGYTGFATLIPDDDTLKIIMSNSSHALSLDLTTSQTLNQE